MDEIDFTEHINERCGEIFLTNQGVLLFLCSLCEEAFKGYGAYLQHIIQKHDLPIFSAEDVIFQSTGSAGDDLTTNAFTETLENESEIDIDDLKEETNCSLTDEQNEEEQSIMLENTKTVDTKVNVIKQNVYKKGVRGIVTANITYECPKCNASIKGKANLDKHILRHDEDNKRFQCSYCPKRFHVRFELKQHEFSHTGERPYLCTDCGGRYVSLGKLNEHINMAHKNIREAVCPICKKAFYSNKYLNKHMQIHSTERRHKCEHCEAAFKLRKTLVAHMKLHTNKREYQCSICDARFNQKPALHAHMKNRHRTKLKQ